MCRPIAVAPRHNQRDQAGCYADEALELFMGAIARAGTRPANYQVKVFGGGNMLALPKAASELMDIATRNVDAAHALLARHGFSPTAAHCGGTGHRKLIFDLWTGHVWLAHTPIDEAA